MDTILSLASASLQLVPACLRSQAGLKIIRKSQVQSLSSLPNQS
ncbi:MAG: hypothetical protein WBO36_09430 [Saprospiraceae bacterium]